MSSLEILDAGALTILVGGAGLPEPADARSHRVAGLLASNPPFPDSPALEVTAGPLEVLAHGTLWLSLAGADLGARTLPDNRRVAPGSGFALGDGQRLRLDGLQGAGLRAYLGTHRGFTAPDGARHLRGARPVSLEPGGLLDVHTTTALTPSRWAGPVTAVPHTVRAVVGPHARLLPQEARDAVWATTWTVGPESDRQGLRLAEHLGVPQGGLGDLPSLPVITGVIQLPPDGRPIILGVDAQPTGGYPVIAVVAAVDRPALGQLRPGDRLRLTPIGAEEGRRAFDADRAALLAAGTALLEAGAWDQLWHDSGA